jgi:periodic tryptophan protein 1
VEDDEGAGDSDEDGGSVDDGEDEEGDVSMDVDGNPKLSDPDDLSAFRMDEYDDEESTGVGECQAGPVADAKLWALFQTSKAWHSTEITTMTPLLP